MYSTCFAGNFGHEKLPSAFFVTGKPASPSNLRACSGLKASPFGCGYHWKMPSGVNAVNGLTILRHSGHAYLSTAILETLRTHTSFIGALLTLIVRKSMPAS